MKQDDPLFEKVMNVTQLVKDGSGLAKQLLGMTRGGKYVTKSTDLNRLIERSINLFGRTKKEISIRTQFQHDVWPVEVDTAQIDQALLHFFVNAWHAMPNGGDLIIDTKNVILDTAYGRSHQINPGKFVKICITDTGAGMDEPTIKRIFDPFFTTKDPASGTGLGLALAYGIIQNHKGMITVYSEKGHGTTFNIYIPISKKKKQEEIHTQEEILSGTGTILFVDDEEVIIQVGNRFLQRLGYRVITANGGEKAVRAFQRNNEKIDLVILDMIMPDMNGGETFNRLKEIDPAVKVLLSSGYTVNGQAKSILDRGCKGFIQKPFSLSDLSKRIHQILVKAI
jgi:CheY-like chemotaxis protein